MQDTYQNRNCQVNLGADFSDGGDDARCRLQRGLGPSLKTADVGYLCVYEHGLEFHWDVPLAAPKYLQRGNRNRIREYSKNSRRQLFKILSRLNFRRLKDATFVTVTYHDNFPHNPAEAKEHSKRFLAKLKTIYPELLYIWKLEFQKRGAPHFHFMFFLPAFSPEKLDSTFNLAVHQVWSSYRACDCMHCAQHSVKISPITSYRGASKYLGKYMAKRDEHLPVEFPGRFWGRSSDLPLKPRTVIRCTYAEWENLKELAIRFLRSRGPKSDNLIKQTRENMSFWIMVGDAEIDDLCFEVWKIIGKPWEYVPILVELAA